MFRKARLKLTGFYLLIIMSVSITFSAVIFRTSNLEIKRYAEAQKIRVERRMGVNPPPFLVDQELIEEARGRILRSLTIINLGILSAAFVLGYYLSGLTLAPIAEMINEQYRFVSDASHELKTPITAIKTTLEVAMRDKNLDLNEAKKTLNTSIEEVNRLQKLAEALLELSRKNTRVPLTPTPLKQVVDDSIKTLEPILRQNKIVIKQKLSKTIVMGQHDLLVRVVTILLDNAIKYSKKGATISIRSNTTSKTISLIIADNGRGIEKADLPHVFDRFYRSEKARSSNGYGLGLSIAKQIIESQNGSIQIESKINSGTKVTITLPYSAKIQSEG